MKQIEPNEFASLCLKAMLLAIQQKWSICWSHYGYVSTFKCDCLSALVMFYLNEPVSKIAIDNSLSGSAILKIITDNWNITDKNLYDFNEGTVYSAQGNSWEEAGYLLRTKVDNLVFSTGVL